MVKIRIAISRMRLIKRKIRRVRRIFMEYRKMGRTGLKVSAFCLGTMMFGRQVEEQESLRIIHKAIDEGVNFIDTADMYANGVTE